MTEPTTPEAGMRLAPCPFCGNDVATQSFWYGCESLGKPRAYHVFCLECSETDSLDGPCRDTLEEAIAAWNTRAAAPVPPAGTEGERTSDAHQLIDQARAVHRRVIRSDDLASEGGWTARQDFHGDLERHMWFVRSTVTPTLASAKPYVVTKAITGSPDVAALLTFVSTALPQLCDLAAEALAARAQPPGGEVGPVAWRWRFVLGDGPLAWNFSEKRVEGHPGPHPNFQRREAQPLYAHPAEPAARGLGSIVQRILSDYQTSETHHPDHVLIRREDFEVLAAQSAKGASA